MCFAVSLSQLHRHSLCPNRCQKHQGVPRTGMATAAESRTSLKHLCLLLVCVAILADRLQAEAIEDLEDRKQMVHSAIIAFPTNLCGLCLISINI